jgi:hypothetical protein
LRQQPGALLFIPVKVEIRALGDQFPLLAETSDVLDRWFELVDRCQVAGKRAHDALGSSGGRPWNSAVADV